METLRIGIDAHAIGAKQGGNETYIRNLIIALAGIDQQNLYRIYLANRQAGKWWRDWFAVNAPNFEVRMIPPPTPLVRAPLALAIELRRDPVDVLHVQYTAPPFCPVPVVVTIHDLAFEHYPETFTRRGSWQLRLTVRRTAKLAARIATVSNFSREDLLQTYGLPPEKVVVTWNGVEERFSPQAKMPNEAESLRRRFGIEGPYLLALGSLQPRKNIERLIRAFRRLRHEAGIRAQLVIVGRDLWLAGAIHEQARGQGSDQGGAQRGDIIFTGYAEDDDLPALYRQASLLVYPSIFEGFGLPPVEAMACGTPVVASNAGSLPEICGEAARLVNPLDEESISAGILEVLVDESLRARLRAAGIKQARRYDWRMTAIKTLELYREACTSKPR